MKLRIIFLALVSMKAVPFLGVLIEIGRLEPIGHHLRDQEARTRKKAGCLKASKIKSSGKALEPGRVRTVSHE